MNSLVHTFLTLAGSTLFIAQAQAAPLSCADIEKADQAGAIVQQPFHSDRVNDSQLQIELLRKAAVLSEINTSSEVAAMTAEELIVSYDPIFKNISIGGVVFHSVDLSLGDNPYVYLFDLNKGEYVDIMSADGSIMVGRDYCDVSDAF